MYTLLKAAKLYMLLEAAISNIFSYKIHEILNKNSTK